MAAVSQFSIVIYFLLISIYINMLLAAVELSYRHLAHHLYLTLCLFWPLVLFAQAPHLLNASVAISVWVQDIRHPSAICRQERAIPCRRRRHSPSVNRPKLRRNTSPRRSARRRTVSIRIANSAINTMRVCKLQIYKHMRTAYIFTYNIRNSNIS